MPHCGVADTKRCVYNTQVFRFVSDVRRGLSTSAAHVDNTVSSTAVHVACTCQPARSSGAVGCGHFAVVHQSYKHVACTSALQQVPPHIQYVCVTVIDSIILVKRDTFNG